MPQRSIDNTKKDKEKEKPLFRIEIVLAGNNLQFYPNVATFHEGLEAVISGFVDTVICITKLVSHVPHSSFILISCNSLTSKPLHNRQ